MTRQLFYVPFSFTFLILLIIIIVFGLGALFLGVILSAFMKIGFSAGDALLILLLSLVGSSINIPLAKLKSDAPVVTENYVRFFGVSYRVPIRRLTRNETILAVNVGGAVIPIIISAYLLTKFPSSAFVAGAGVLIVTLVTHAVARPIRGIGIATPALIPPLTAAVAAFVLPALIHTPELAVEQSRFVTAYAGGVLGTLLGADILNLGKIRDLGAPIASIGGAGTFDGIFLSGFIALLLV